VSCDLLVEGAAVVTVDPEWRILDPGYVAVEGGRITRVGPGSEAPREASRRIDGRGRLLLPGFVNAHTHVSMSAFRGACEDVDDRLARYIFPMEAALVDRELVYEGARFCLAEMARSGTTTFADMYYFEDEVARAAKEAGLRCLLGETIVGFPAPDAPEPAGGLEYGARFAREWRGDPLVSPCLAPHAAYTLDAGVLARVRDEAERLGVPIMMHVAETAAEDARFRASGGSSLRYLDSLGLVGPRLLAAHMIYLDGADIELAARRGMAVAHCPASNAKSGRPISPALALMEAGVRLGLATDGPISGNGMDMMGVLGLFPKLQKVLTGRRDAVSAQAALRAATMGGAEALGMADRIGSIEAGKRADLVLYDAEDFNLQPVYDWYATAVYALRPHNARTVIVDGRVVVEEGRMTGFDEEGSKAAMRSIRDRCSGEIERLAKETR
jgi:5-methylthioadenosine/S-adenosylhomocysteine deaminase